MQPIKTRFYYDKKDGNVFFQSNLYGDISVGDEILKFIPLQERTRETFDALDIKYGDYARDFAESSGYRVNPETKTLEFAPIDPNQPEEPKPYQKPLSDQIKDLETKYDAAVMELTMLVAGGM